MKRVISLLIVLTMILSMFSTMSVFAASGEVIMNFDDKTSFEQKKDYIIGGAGYKGKIEVTSEKDHTTGTGKSIKMADRESNTHRIKILNAIPNSLLDKNVVVSAWVMADIDTKLSVGAFSDVSTTYAFEPYKIKVVDVKKDTWTHVEFDFKHNEQIVTQIGIAQDKDAMKGELAKNIFIDDLCVKEGTAKKEEVKTETVETPKKNQGLTTVKYNFDDIEKFEENIDYIRGGAYPKHPVITNEKDHTTGSGKSLKMAGRENVYQRLKFVDVITEKMFNNTIFASCYVYSPVDAKISIGAYSTTNTTYAVKPYSSKSYEVKKDTWTPISLTFDHKDALVTQIGIGQEGTKDTDPLAETIYIDDLVVCTISKFC